VSWKIVAVNRFAEAERCVQLAGCHAGMLDQGENLERVNAEGLEDQSMSHPERPTLGWLTSSVPTILLLLLCDGHRDVGKPLSRSDLPGNISRAGVE
jgi:hypothetical protein